MRIRYDPEVDAMSIVFRETTVTTRPLAEGIAADYDAQGRLAGIEILDALKRFGDRSTLRQVILEGIGPGVSASSGEPSPAQKAGGSVLGEEPTAYREGDAKKDADGAKDQAD